MVPFSNRSARCEISHDCLCSVKNKLRKWLIIGVA